jgi:hypothetical protein
MRRLLFPLLFCLLLTGCANKVVRGNQAFNKRVLFQFTVQGRLALNNPNVTYYIVLNAPSGRPDSTIDPTLEGPRVNGVSLNNGAEFLLGRLPFVGLLPGDIESKWTDFYYLQGSASGTGVMGRGRLVNGVPEILVRNYPNSLWRVLNDSSFEVQILFSDLTSAVAAADAATPGAVTATPPPPPLNFTANLATGDNIEVGGQGFLFDRWRANVPFAIRTDVGTPFEDLDPDTQLVMRQIPGKIIPQLPPGVNAADVNISAYRYQIIQ